MNEKIYDVSELNAYIKELLDSSEILASVFVRGELSNYKVYASGHHYFTIKDKGGALRCVMFRREATSLKFKPEDGMKVVAFGRITVYPRDGAYQLYCAEMTPLGIGDLYYAFEQLKTKLSAEGLFEADHKKPIPQFPEKIALITSGSGAAVHDMIRILGKRYPLAKVIVMPVRVQGTESPPELVGALKYANLHSVADLIIIGRGGGSIEDLWAFNDERVARAVYASEIPVISAVGHEPDVTICDYVSDLRAATPSNGAELAVPDRIELAAGISGYSVRLQKALKRRTDSLSERLNRSSSSEPFKNPLFFMQQRRMTVDSLTGELISAARNDLGERKTAFHRLAAALDAMSPLKVLSRGYGLVTDAEGKPVREAAAVKVGQQVNVRLASGSMDCKIENINK